MKRFSIIAAVGLMFVLYGQADAAITSVAGGPSSAGTLPAFIGAPAHALDDLVFNTGMEGFDEAQSVVTTAAHGIDGGGTIPVGSLVDSHMIFLNSQGTGGLTHNNVLWTFDGMIIGVMSDYNGNLESASTFELGNPATNYTVPFGVSGPAPPFPARGMEGADSYLVSGNTITVNMGVSEPGDWIRVVTAPIPAPGALLLGSLGMGLVGWMRRRRAL